MMSTPAATSVDIVREKRAIVILRTVCPICSGRRSLVRSQSRRPRSVCLKRITPKIDRPNPGKMMYQAPRSRSETFTTYCVSVGSWPFSCAKIFVKIGTRNSSIPFSVERREDRGRWSGTPSRPSRAA